MIFHFFGQIKLHIFDWNKDIFFNELYVITPWFTVFTVGVITFEKSETFIFSLRKKIFGGYPVCAHLLLVLFS